MKDKSLKKGELNELRTRFKTAAKELMKEMFGFYNTEAEGGGLVLSAQEKRSLDR